MGRAIFSALGVALIAAALLAAAAIPATAARADAEVLHGDVDGDGVLTVEELDVWVGNALEASVGADVAPPSQLPDPAVGMSPRMRMFQCGQAGGGWSVCRWVSTEPFRTSWEAPTLFDEWMRSMPGEFAQQWAVTARRWDGSQDAVVEISTLPGAGLDFAQARIEFTTRMPVLGLCLITMYWRS